MPCSGTICRHRIWTCWKGMGRQLPFPLFAALTAWIFWPRSLCGLRAGAWDWGLFWCGTPCTGGTGCALTCTAPTAEPELFMRDRALCRRAKACAAIRASPWWKCCGWRPCLICRGQWQTGDERRTGMVTAWQQAAMAVPALMQEHCWQRPPGQWAAGVAGPPLRSASFRQMRRAVCGAPHSCAPPEGQSALAGSRQSEIASPRGGSCQKGRRGGSRYE